MLKLFARLLVSLALVASPAAAAQSGWSTSNYIEKTSGVITATPVTMCGWINTTSLGAVQVPFGIFASGSTAASSSFRVQVQTTGGITATTNGSSATTSTGLVTTNTWAHLCGVFTSATSRAAFVNGANKATDTASATPSSLNRQSIGLIRGSSANSPAVGSLAEVAFWNVALSDAEVAALGKGMSPKLVRPASLIEYIPMVRSIIDVKGSGASVTGSLTAADHVPIRGD